MSDPTSIPDPDGSAFGAALRPRSGPLAPGDDTRAALIRAGVELFGRRGFDGTTTREIAAAAGVNIAGIAYHFGSKSGLHRACGEAIAEIVLEHVGEVPLPTVAIGLLPSAAATELVVMAVTRLARFILGRPEAEAVARFMVREQMDPTETFTALYARLIRPRHELMCRLFARATGEDPASEAVIIAVSAMFGQIMFFRVGRATALARLGWEEIGPDGLDAILAVITTNIRATIAARRAAKSGQRK